MPDNQKMEHYSSGVRTQANTSSQAHFPREHQSHHMGTPAVEETAGRPRGDAVDFLISTAVACVSLLLSIEGPKKAFGLYFVETSRRPFAMN
jgi:hypothetical protein